MTFLYYKRQEPTFSIGNSWKMHFARTRRSDILFHALTKTVIVILRSKGVFSPFRYFLGQKLLFFLLLSEVLMVEEASLQQLKVYHLQLEAYLLQFCSTECFAQREDCLLLVQGILYLLQSGWYQKGHRLLDFYVF